MASAFGWSPGGCCCESFPGPWAMGVNDLSNPTGTRIPRRCTVTYSGIAAKPSPPAPNTIKQLDIDLANWFNAYVDSLQAFNPFYSFGDDGRLGIPTNNYPVNTSLASYAGAMHFSSARPENVTNATWPGYAGGSNSTLSMGLLPKRPVDPPVDFAGPLILNPGESAAIFNYGTHLAFATGYPFYSPMYPNAFNETTRTVKEVTLVPGRWFDVSGATTPIDDRLQMIFCGDFAPGQSSRIYVTYSNGVRYRNHTFSPGRNQPICVIPESITFRQQHLVQEGAIFGNMTWETLVVNVVFSDWFEGPLATPP